MDNFRYPTTDQGLQALVTQPADANVRNWKQGGYIRRHQERSVGNDYAYISPGTRGEYDIYTLGADGQPGGEGPDTDNRQLEYRVTRRNTCACTPRRAASRCSNCSSSS
jgi:general secretion pathway protein G